MRSMEKKNPMYRSQLLVFVGASASTMLPSAQFVCLRVAYQEAFWENLVRLTWQERSIRRPLLFWVQVIFFNSLKSRVGCSFQGKLFSIFKLLCLLLLHVIFLPVLLTLFFPNCLLFVIALRSSWENCFAETRCSVWIARENWVSAFASTDLLYPNECQLLDSTVIT